MDHIKYISHNTPDSIDSIKIASLYFDSIEVATFVKWFGMPTEKPTKFGIFFERFHYENTFFQHIDPFIKAGIVRLGLDYIKPARVTTEPQVGYSYGDSDEIYETIVLNLKHIILNPPNIPKKIPEGSEFIVKAEPNDELRSVMAYLGRSEDGLFATEYYSHLLSIFLRNLANGENCMTSSEALNNYLIAHFNSSSFNDVKRKIQRELNVNPSIAMEAIKLGLPNISRLSSDDILELKLKMKDELIAFKTYLTDLQLDLEKHFDERYIAAKAPEIVKTKISPALDDLADKLDGLKLNVASTILKEIKDPKSYSPLLLSVTNNITPTCAILVSIGLMSLTTALDHYKQNKEVKKNGLYYLLKLRAT